ncbi:hypothetical protein FRB96_001186 [Tulasnella sp. 330]|nr:hypothetical protein FRB96_001186 [Tulasnella sp. 330]
MRAPSGVRSAYNTTVYHQSGLPPTKDGSDNHKITISVAGASSTFVFDYAIISSFLATTSIVPVASTVPIASTVPTAFTPSTASSGIPSLSRRRRTRLGSQRCRAPPTSPPAEPIDFPTPLDAYIIEPYAVELEDEIAVSDPLLSPKAAQSARWQNESQPRSPLPRLPFNSPFYLPIPLSISTVDHSNASATLGSPSTISETNSNARRIKGTLGVTNGTASPTTTAVSSIPPILERPASDRAFSPMSAFGLPLSPATPTPSSLSFGSPQSGLTHPSKRLGPSPRVQRSNLDVVSPEVEAGTSTSLAASLTRGLPSPYIVPHQQQPS